MPAFGPLYGGNSMSDRLSHLFEDKHLDLRTRSPETPNSSASTPSGIGFFGQAPRFEDPALANVEFR
jgi:hypothetical protein